MSVRRSQHDVYLLLDHGWHGSAHPAHAWIRVPSTNVRLGDTEISRSERTSMKTGDTCKTRQTVNSLSRLSTCTRTHTSHLRDNWLVGGEVSLSACVSICNTLVRRLVSATSGDVIRAGDYYLPVNRLDLHLQLVFHSVHLHVSSLQQVRAGRWEPGTHQSFHLPQTSCSHWFLRETDQTRHARHAHAAPRSLALARAPSTVCRVARHTQSTQLA